MNRDQLEHELLHLLPPEHMTQAMKLIDTYTTTLLAQNAGEVWTADEVASFLGLADANSARATMSRWEIAAVGRQVDPENGRVKSLYPAERVRAECEARRSSG